MLLQEVNTLLHKIRELVSTIFLETKEYFIIVNVSNSTLNEFTILESVQFKIKSSGELPVVPLQ